jgi:hypothetical protein
MPSKHQSGGGTSGDYDSDEKRMLAVKNDLTIAALIRGICDPDRAQSYIDAEIELAAEEDRDPRKGVIGACNRKITALEDEDTDANDADVDTNQTPADDEDADTPSHGPQDDADSDEADVDTDDDPYADVPRFEDDDALADAIEDHEHGDVFTTAKPEGKLAGCFECESHIGFVPRDG